MSLYQQPGRIWWEAYLAAYQVAALDDDCEDPVGQAAADADDAIEAYAERFDISGKPHEEEE